MLLRFHKGKRHSRLKSSQTRQRLKSKDWKVNWKGRFEKWLPISKVFISLMEAVSRALLIQRSKAITSLLCLFKSIIRVIFPKNPKVWGFETYQRFVVEHKTNDWVSITLYFSKAMFIMPRALTLPVSLNTSFTEYIFMFRSKRREYYFLLLYQNPFWRKSE